MRKALKITNAILTLAAMLGFAVFANAQSIAGTGNNKTDTPEKIQTNEPARTVAATDKVKRSFWLPKSKSVLSTGPTANPFNAATRSGNGPESGTLSQAQTSGEDPQALAKKLANPISSLISVPFQNNFDFGMGPDKHGFRYTMNFQPVIPFALNKNWNLISRTIVPVITQHKVAGTGTHFGLGDTLQSFFFSPNKTEPFIWGVGPVLLIPTATNKVLGTQKFAIGPTIVVLKQQKQWTVGMLANHLWSVAGKESRANVSSTFVQPFISYTTKTAWTFTFNTESTYDWTAKTWSVPIHAQATKLVKFGKQPVSVGGGIRCWAASAPGGPHWCGFRFIFTPLFPKK
jgi:hypothetical protein